MRGASALLRAKTASRRRLLLAFLLARIARLCWRRSDRRGPGFERGQWSLGGRAAEATLHRQPGGRGADPAFGDKRVSDQHPDACLRGRMLDRAHARFATPAPTDGSAAALMLSPDPSVCGLGSARLLSFSRQCRPGYRNGDTAIVRIRPCLRRGALSDSPTSERGDSLGNRGVVATVYTERRGRLVRTSFDEQPIAVNCTRGTGRAAGVKPSCYFSLSRAADVQASVTSRMNFA